MDITAKISLRAVCFRKFPQRIAFHDHDEIRRGSNIRTGLGGKHGSHEYQQDAEAREHEQEAALVGHPVDDMARRLTIGSHVAGGNVGGNSIV